MTSATPDLAAVREALLTDARQAAAEVHADSDRHVASILADGRDEAERLLARARAEGEADARAIVASELARARRQAREVVLAARRDVYEECSRAARAAARRLRTSPDHPALVDGLASQARRQIGADATIERDEDAGGLIATAGTRSVDYRLTSIAERCLVDLGDSVEQLWR